MSLRTINLNLLPVLRALLREGSVSRAATELSLSQPATSNALKRLRVLLGDPLLVQVGRGMRLTPRARRLLPMLDEACAKIDALLREGPFDPAATRRSFVIEAADYLGLLLGIPLNKMLGEVAPFARVNFTHADGSFRDELGSGVVDIAIVAWDRRSARGFSHMHGYLDRMVGVVRRDHPFASRPPRTAQALRAYPQVGLEPRFYALGAMTSIGRRMGALKGYQRLGAQSFLLLPLFAAQSDCVTIVPKVLAEQVRGMAPIAMFELPGDPIVVDAAILWSPIYDADPVHRWFRGLVAGILSKHFDVGGLSSGRQKRHADGVPGS